RPTIIIVKTTLGYGSPHKAGTSEAHGSPLGKEEVVLTKKALGWEWEEPFYVPPESLEQFRSAVARGRQAQDEWEKRFARYEREFPDLAAEWRRRQAGELPPDWGTDLPTFKAGEKEATRTAAGKVENAIAAKLPELIGGDGDLGVSTNTPLKGAPSFDGRT